MLLGRVPYLNGGLFDVHDLEQDNPEIHIPDEAFAQIFDFFDAYQWHLDDRPLRNDNEINPDVLGYIFEKYINQKQMGAYYTNEDITGYISRNTVIPFLFDRAKKECSIAFKPGGGIWRLLSEDPDRYFHEAVRHGITYDIHTKEVRKKKRDLPPEIAAGLNDLSNRGGWNKPAPRDYALPTETWREHVARRRRYEEIRAKLAAGEVTSIDDLITYNLDIEKFAQDVIAWSEGPELIRAFWKAISQVSILDPTCGSGAFLFVALNILEPIYTACLESMQGFLDDLERSKHKHHPEKMRDFRKVLKRVEEHASERYFILKSIIIDNLYGVDIMEEAVEICKLRLFLKLVAQLDSYDQIEPLPDVDFNVRAGNTLVGFTTLKEIQDTFVTTPDGQQRMLYPEDVAKLKRIEEDAEIADRAFRQFRDMQTERKMDAVEFTISKTKLRKRLDNLRVELDQNLAGNYGIKVGNNEPYIQWRLSHQPFHWLVEFYGIMHCGGFDVIVGNPPYVEYRRVKKEYQILDYSTKQCGNLYAQVMERSGILMKSGGRFGMIVPLSICSSKRMVSLRSWLLRTFPERYIANFEIFPSKLFEGAFQRVSIVIGTKDKPGQAFISRLHRWYSIEREVLINKIVYTGTFVSSRSKLFFKIQNKTNSTVLEKLSQAPETISLWCSRGPTKHFVFYLEATNYWAKATTRIPYYKKNGIVKSPAHSRTFYLDTQEHSTIAMALLNSSLFYLWYISLSDGFHMNDSIVKSFPINNNLLQNVHLLDVSSKLEKDIKKNSFTTTRNTKVNLIEVEAFKMSISKPIIDEIDRALAKYYGFTEEEQDFIINYDIKYRMGLGNLRGRGK